MEQRGNKKKVIFFYGLIFLLVFSLLSSCTGDAMPDGKDALFSKEYLPQKSLLTQLSSKTNEDIEAFNAAFNDLKKTKKVDLDLKINKLSLGEGISLDNSNKFKGVFYYNDTNLEGSLDLSLMGSKLEGKVFRGDTELILELSELENYLRLPFDDMQTELEDFSFMDIDDILDSAKKTEELQNAFKDLSKKVGEILKSDIPDSNITTKKEKVKWNDKNVNGKIITLDLSGDEISSPLIKVLEYIKSDKRFEEVVSPMFAMQYVEDEDISFEKAIDDLIEKIKKEDSKSISLSIVATYVKSHMVSLEIDLHDEEEATKIKVSYSTNDLNSSLDINIIDDDSKEVKIKYTEDFEKNRYKLTIKDDENDMAIAFNIKDEYSYEVDVEVKGNEDEEFKLSFEITLSEIKKESVKYKLGFKFNDVADIELNIGIEILDTYNFNTPKVDNENSYDITDDEDAILAMIEVSEKYEWLTEFFGFSPNDFLDLSIEFLDEDPPETSDRMSVLDNVLDGNGGLYLFTMSGRSVSYEYDGDILFYGFEEYDENEHYFYFDGEAWNAVDHENETMSVVENVILVLPEVIIFGYEAEFVDLGYANVGEDRCIFEAYSYPSLGSIIYYFFDDEGDLIYIYDSDTVYYTAFSDEVDLSLYDIGSYTTKV